MIENDGSCIVTILLLEHSPQFGNFAEVDPPPLLILRHDDIWFAYKTASTSDIVTLYKVLHVDAQGAWLWRRLLYLSGEC